MTEHNIDAWTVYDAANDNCKDFDSRSHAEDAVETANELGGDAELYGPGESPYDDAETDGGSAAEVIAEETGNPSEEYESDAEVPEPQDLESVSAMAGGMAIDSDPLNVLPGWMTTQVSYNDKGDSSTTVNKRGCQVIAEYLGLDMVDRNVVKRAHETDFDFATYEITLQKPDGRTFTGTGTARADDADQGDDAGWKLDMMAETRAYKRAVKSATGGGIEAFAKEQGENR